jgi:hypothetical protein
VVNFLDKYYELISKADSEFKLVDSTFNNGPQKLDANLRTKLSTGDKIKIEYSSLDSESVQLLVRYNSQIVLEIKLSKNVLVFIKYDSDVGDTMGNHTKPGVFLKNMFDLAKEDSHISDLNALIGLKLEACDIKTGGLVEPAEITEVNKEANLVKVHFVGWGLNYDYWTELSSDNLLPAGCMGYLFTNKIKIPLRFACTKLKSKTTNTIVFLTQMTFSHSYTVILNTVDCAHEGFPII